MLVKKTEVDMVTQAAESVGGKKLEPEERPVLTTDHIVTQAQEGDHLRVGEMRSDPTAGITHVGVNATHVRIESAKEAADYLSAGQCVNCRHFDVKRGQEAVEAMRRSRDPEDLREFYRMRNELSAITALDIMGSSIFMDQRDEDTLRKVVGSELREIGRCAAHSAFHQKNILVMPEGTCLDLGGATPNLFEGLDSSFDKALEQTRDRVLQMAQDASKK